MRDDLIEAAWDALKNRCCADPANAKKCVMVSREDFRAAFAAIEAAGCVVVPREPSEAMRLAGADKLFGSTSDDWGDDAAYVYAAMIAAAGEA